MSKGSKRRPGKLGSFERGYEAIDWSKGRKSASPRKETWMTEKLNLKEIATLDEMLRRQESTCGGEDGCTNPPTEPHTCPYQVEINSNSEFTCECCDECRAACAWTV